MSVLSAGRISLLAAGALMLVFLVLGVYTAVTNVSQRDRLAEARRAQEVSDAYQQTRFDIPAAESLAVQYVGTHDTQTRWQFDAAVNALLADVRSIAQAGGPDDQKFVDEFEQSMVPELQTAQAFFTSLAEGTAFTGQLPSADIPVRVRATLDQLAADRRASANAMFASQARDQSANLRLTLAAYAAGIALVGALLATSRAFASRDAKHRAESAERQRSVGLLRENEERYRRLVESSPVAMVIYAGGTTEYANEAMGKLIGAPSASALTGRQIADLLPLDSLEAPREQAPGPTPAPSEQYLVHASGERIPVEATVVTTTLDGRPMNVATVRDLSAQKRSEEERLEHERTLLEAEKLESLTVLAGGVAHDFNNLLVGILGNAGLALNQLQPDSPAQEIIQDIELSARRASGLAREMLNYSGKGRFRVERVDVNEMVSETTHLALASTSRRAAVSLNLAGSLPSVEGDATQLRQVVMNLVINAADAIGEHEGIVTVSTRSERLTPEVLRGLVRGEDLADGEYVCIEVTDNGSGMEPDVLSKIFEPFFTTKFSGRGLGLPAVMGVVRGHRGTIRVMTELGAGSTFSVFLPAAGSDSCGDPQIAKATRAPVPPRAAGVVLVVDDEAAVRTMVARALRSLGFDVLSARDGQEGVDLFRGDSDAIVCVLLDLTMPRMNGVDALRAIRSIRQDAVVIVMSGYDERDVTNQFAHEPPSAFIQKPFDLETLTGVIASAVAA